MSQSRYTICMDDNSKLYRRDGIAAPPESEVTP